MRRPVADALSGCNPDQTGLLSYKDVLVELDTGDIRAEGSELQGLGWGCIGDAFEIAACWQGTSDRCAPVIELDTPLFTRLDWVPAGPKLHGDACTFTPAATGAHDDCAAGLFCYQGTCHTICSSGQTIDGYPSEVLLCD
jgi:hypothetical protein